MPNDVDGYVKPGSLTLPAWLNPEERRQALELLDEIERAIDSSIADGASSSVESGQAFVERLNETPERLRSYARLNTGLPVSAATAHFDGLSPDGQYLISFQLDFNESNADESSGGAVDESSGSDHAGA